MAIYKLPERLEIVDFFPMAGGPKIDKKKLREIAAGKLQEKMPIEIDHRKKMFRLPSLIYRKAVLAET